MPQTPQMICLGQQPLCGLKSWSGWAKRRGAKDSTFVVTSQESRTGQSDPGDTCEGVGIFNKHANVGGGFRCACRGGGQIQANRRGGQRLGKGQPYGGGEVSASGAPCRSPCPGSSCRTHPPPTSPAPPSGWSAEPRSDFFVTQR